MKKLLLGILAIFTTHLSIFGQNQFEILSERPNEKSFKGIISRDVLEKDSTFKWFASNQKGYTPNTTAASALRQFRDSIELLVFMGTWCEDSHIIIPRFYSLLDATGFEGKKVTLIGTDRNKKTLSHLSEALNVNNVPTIIVMKEGKELGRVIEYVKTGLWDKELGELINSSFGK
jgi:thiol-disulfide isomerase/thioredoxin